MRATICWSGLVALALLVAGCASPVSGGSVGPTSSAAELGESFGSCTDGDPGETVDPREFLSDDVERWVQVTRVVNATRQADGDQHTFPATIATADGSTEDVRIHNTFLAGVDWGLEEGDAVWMGIGSEKDTGSPPLMMSAMVVTPQGVFFPGDCQDATVRIPLEKALGDRTTEVLIALPTTAPSKAAALLGIGAPTPTVASEDVPQILNPEDAPAELLNSLGSVSIHVRITQALGKGETSPSLCTHIAEGWGDCVMTDDSVVEGVDFSAYTNTSGQVELWLLNGDADVTQPIGYLGSIELPTTRSTSDPDKLDTHTVDVVVDTTNIDLSALPDEPLIARANKEDRVTVKVLN